jgi:hydroxypyruvate isomerase
LISPLRYATHLGYLSPDEPLFPASVGSLDPVDHIKYAASQGFSGTLYPWAVARPADEVSRVVSALRENNVVAGCLAYASFEDIQLPLWVRTGVSSREELLRRVRVSVRMAGILGSPILVMLLAGDGTASVAGQRRAAIDNVRSAADIAAESGLVIGIEPMIALPNMLFERTAEVAEFVLDVAHPAFKIVFDTGHAAVMDGTESVLPLFRDLYDHIAVLQLADHPGRVEPGAGSIDFIPVLAHAMQRHFTGLVELEHGWSNPGIRGETSGLANFKELDRAAWQHARATRSTSH